MTEFDKNLGSVTIYCHKMSQGSDINCHKPSEFIIICHFLSLFIISNHMLSEFIRIVAYAGLLQMNVYRSKVIQVSYLTFSLT